MSVSPLMMLVAVYLLITLFITGCTPLKPSGDIVIPKEIEYIEVPTPIMVCPPPPAIEKPKLYISKLKRSDKGNHSKIAKYYHITLKQLKAYSKRLERVIEEYKEISKQYESMQNDIEKGKNKTWQPKKR